MTVSGEAAREALNATLALADELREALDDPRRGEWGGYPWEHLGDAERDVRPLLDALASLASRLEAAERERDKWRAEARIAGALVDHLNGQVAWEKTEHDKARDEWLIMREGVTQLHRGLRVALETVEPPEEWEPSWADYGDGLEADPYGWLATLVAEALDEHPPPPTYDEAASAALSSASGTAPAEEKTAE